MSSDAEATPVNPLRSWLGVAVFVFLSMLAAAGFKSYRDLDAVRTLEADLSERIELSRSRIERMHLRLERIESDPLTLERLAREELGMVRDGDVVIVLPPADAAEAR